MAGPPSGRSPDELVEAAAEREVGDDTVAAASYGTAGEVTGLRLGPRGAPAGPGI